MRSATIAAAVMAAVLVSTVGACSGSGGDGDSGRSDRKTTATVTVTATPTLSQAETERQCSVAVAAAAPGWEDWNYSPGDWQDDPRTPEVCQGLADEENPPRGNRAFMDALIKGLEMADDPRARQ